MNASRIDSSIKMSRHFHQRIIFALLTALAVSCGKGGQTSYSPDKEQQDTVNWTAEAKDRYYIIVQYSNNNHLDSLRAQAPQDFAFYREHGLWRYYYDTWRLLAESYHFNGEEEEALREAQLIHDDAAARENPYGQAVADYIQALAYDAAVNHDEASKSFRKALEELPQDSFPDLRNVIFTYLVFELEQMKDTVALKATLDEWQDCLEKHRDLAIRLKGYYSNWKYLYHRSAYRYKLLLDDQQGAAADVDSIEENAKVIGMSPIVQDEILNYRVQLAMLKGDYAKALELNDKQIEGAENLSFINQTNVLGTRRELLANMKRWEEAYNTLLEYSQRADSVNREDTRQQLNELNKKFEVDELKMQAERERMAGERRQLMLLAAIVAIVLLGVIFFVLFRLHAARRLAKVNAAKERMEGELNVARDIQMSMVPSTFPDLPGLDMYASMTPAKEVGGDLYGYVIEGDTLYFALGDVSGKGVPASLFMAQATRLFTTMAHQGMEPSAICTRMNSELSGEDNVNGMFVTMFIGMLDLQTGHLRFCNAGHNPPVIGGGESHGDFLDMVPNAPIGLWPGLEYEGEEIDCIQNRPLFIYTDGLNEAENRSQEQFGDDHLLDVLRHTHFDTARQVIETLQADVERHRDGAEPNDDLTMMCIRVSK